MKKIKIIILLLILFVFYSCKKEEPKATIEYPTNGLYGVNVLDSIKTVYTGENFSLAANLNNGAELKVILRKVSGGWFTSVGTENNWEISDYNAGSQIFTTLNKDLKCDLEMEFNVGEYIIEYYELGSKSITKQKTIEIK